MIDFLIKVPLDTWLVFWFILAMCFVSLEAVIFKGALRKRGIPVWEGFFNPGDRYAQFWYFGFSYVKWCKKNSKNPFPRLFIKVLLWINLIIATYYGAYRL